MARSREQPQDVARFRELIENNWTAVEAYCRRGIAGYFDPEDVLAEVFAIAWRRLDHVPSGDGSRPWLFGVARNLVLAQRRRTDWHTLIAERVGRQLMTRPSNNDDDARDGRETLAVVESALLALSDEDRELIELVAWHGLTHADIALMLGCSANAVAIRLHRARQMLETELRARDAER